MSARDRKTKAAAAAAQQASPAPSAPAAQPARKIRPLTQLRVAYTAAFLLIIVPLLSLPVTYYACSELLGLEKVYTQVATAAVAIVLIMASQVRYLVSALAEE
eukprot:m51a1_g10397 hypothetical protein (103) ;mRNA; f:67044-67435